MTRMLRIFAKTKRMRMVILILILILILMIILTTGIISSLWKLRLCILLRGRGHKYLLLDVHDHVYKKKTKGIFINWLNFEFSDVELFGAELWIDLLS